MGLRIQNNIAALNAHRQLTISDRGLSKSLERLSSGYRINSAADDAAGLAISNAMRADIASFKVASRNTSEANSLLKVASGGLDEISNMLTRLKELATQASSANADSNVSKINSEAQKIISEIDRIAESTEYADNKLINGTFGVSVSANTANVSAGGGYSGISGMTTGGAYTFTADATTLQITDSNGNTETVAGISAPSGDNSTDVYFASQGITLTVNSNYTASSDFVVTACVTGSSQFQVGAENVDNNRINVSLGDATKETLGTSNGSSALTDIDMGSAGSAQSALDYIDAAIADLADVQGNIGAYQNRLSFAAANLSVTIENTQAGESVIRDVDMAYEMVSFTKFQILQQAGTAMLAQANMAPQSVLSLFG